MAKKIKNEDQYDDVKLPPKLPAPYPFEVSVIEPEETLFPEKLAKAKEVLRNCKFIDTSWGH